MLTVYVTLHVHRKCVNPSGGEAEVNVQARERLTRTKVVDAALRVMDEEGLDALSMRRLGRELGVEAMSLYNHVHDKDDLLESVCERVMAEFDFPEPAQDWIETGRKAARSWRRLLKAHPNVISLFAERTKPFTNPESLKPMEFALKVLKEGGLSDKEALMAFHAFGGYIQGFVMMELGQMWRPSDQLEPMSGFDADEFPCVAAAMPYMSGKDVDEQFEFGLDLMMRGLVARLGRS
jgi:AcrR family transcriptional regulator